MTLWLLFSSLTVPAQSLGPSDSLRLVLDSLEVEMLKITRTYAQVDRLIQTLPLRPDYLDRLPSVLPVAVVFREFEVSSPFGFRMHPIHKKARFHGGIDVRAKEGVSVWATAPGIIKRVGYDEDLGAFVQVVHSFGFETTYGHLSVYSVQPGQYLDRGCEVGRVGKKGL